MPIDLSAVNWAYVAVLAVLAFVASLIGNLVSFRNRLVGAIIAAIVFAVLFVLWTYYPHDNIPGPISVNPAPTLVPPAPPVPPAPLAAPAAPNTAK